MEKALARLRELAAKLKELIAKDAPTAEDLAALKATTKEYEDQEALIETLKAAEAAHARSAAPADQPLSRERDTVPAAAKVDLSIEERFSIAAAATVKAAVTKQPALKVLSEGGYDAFAKELETGMRKRAITTDGIEILIPETTNGAFVPYLRPETTFFQGNPKRVTFTNGKFRAPRGLTGTTASYVGEGQKKPTTDVTFDELEMSPKKLAAIVLITKEARDWSVMNIDAYIRDDLRSTMAQTLDLNAWFGTGAGLSPTGILKHPGVPQYDAADFGANAATAPSITQVDAIASRMTLSLTESNIYQSPSWRWLMSYRTLEFLKNLRVGDDTGVYAYPELRLPVPNWKGIPVLVTNVVPTNLGGGTNESLLALVDFRYVLYGEEGGVTVSTSTEATVDVNGTLVLLWQQNMYGILTEHQHDFGLQYDNAAAVLNGIQWGSELMDVGTGSPT